jgi:hypothetical protein
MKITGRIKNRVFAAPPAISFFTKIPGDMDVSKRDMDVNMR